MRLKQIKFELVAVVAISFFLSCSNDTEESARPATSEVKKEERVKSPVLEVKKEVTLSKSPTLGSYLSDQDGRTLYFFALDSKGAVSPSNGDEILWPAFYVDKLTADQVDKELTFSDFTTVTTKLGKKQLTYKGWPLYYYAPVVDGKNTLEAVGKTTGDGKSDVMFIAKPDYSIMLVHAQLLGHDEKKYTLEYKVGEKMTTYFTDASGVTLYTFTSDTSKKNTFTKADFSNNTVWPIYETDKIVVPSILDKSKFSIITVFGKSQLTYNGWPLYYFGQDKNVRGINKGISFPTPGIWPVAVAGILVAK